MAGVTLVNEERNSRGASREGSATCVNNASKAGGIGGAVKLAGAGLTSVFFATARDFIRVARGILPIRVKPQTT